jgi:hypothetical protein
MNSCNLYNTSNAALSWTCIGVAEEVKDSGNCLIGPVFFRTGLLKPGVNIGPHYPPA